ncbi:MAG: class IV adenylate cyclase [Candidatus Paceibacterota bacterium]|jgi:adenylate cyclase class 2
MYEVEVKARLKNKDEIIKKLEDMGCSFGEELHQIDHIFIPKEMVFPPPYNVPVLRVRKQNDKNIFTMKISQSNRQDCIEHELEISDGEKMLEIMHLINYKKVPVVNKKRIKTKLQGMEIVIDVVENLGEFIEVERIVSEENAESRQKIQEELLNFLSDLGVSKEDHLAGSKYDIMLFEKYGMEDF